MKRNFMKKAVAVSLSAAMAFSLSSATALMTASAASTVAMAKTASVKVGKSKTLKLTKNTKKWKVKAVSSTNKKYCTIKKVNSKSVKITGKKATAKSQTVTVRVRVKSSVKKVEKVLKCKVTVKGTTTSDPGNADPTPENPTGPGQEQPPVIEKEKTVATQEDLDAALADSNVEKITIQTANEVKLAIGEGTYNADLIVDAAAADIENSGTFNSITINSIAPDTWKEKGKGNKFTINAPAHIELDAAAEGSIITVASSKAKLEITGKAKDKVQVSVDANAAGATVKSAAPISVIAAAKIDLILEKSATGSEVKLQKGAVKFSITLTNRTDEDIEVQTTDGEKIYKAEKGTENVTTPEVPVIGETNPNPGPSTDPGSSTTTEKKDITEVYNTAQIKYEAASASFNGATVTPAALGLPTNLDITLKLGNSVVEGVTYTTGGTIVYKPEDGTPKGSPISGADVGYYVEVEDPSGTAIVSSICDAGDNTFTLLEKGDMYSQWVSPKFGEYTIKISVFVKENDNYKESDYKDAQTIKIDVPQGTEAGGIPSATGTTTENKAVKGYIALVEQSSDH